MGVRACRRTHGQAVAANEMRVLAAFGHLGRVRDHRAASVQAQLRLGILPAAHPRR